MPQNGEKVHKDKTPGTRECFVLFHARGSMEYLDLDVPSRSSDATLPYAAHLGLPHAAGRRSARQAHRSEEHTSELQSRLHLVCRLLLEKKKQPYMQRET